MLLPNDLSVLHFRDRRTGGGMKAKNQAANLAASLTLNSLVEENNGGVAASVLPLVISLDGRSK
jgi:hypothetical protein